MRENENGLLENLTPLFERMEYKVHAFQRETYEGLFREYMEENRLFFEELNARLAAEETEKMTDAYAQFVVDWAAKQLAGISGKREREREQINYNMFMAVYFLPAVLEGRQAAAQKFADSICEKWAAAFKGSNIQASDYASIASGFKTKLCYITTAVCKSLQKPDNCYELELLRSYRDHYLMQTKEGEALVEKYYDVAPTIVKRIDKSADAKEKYTQIWESYLKPCVKAIEDGALEVCGETYVQMVETLCTEYMTTNHEGRR